MSVMQHNLTCRVETNKLCDHKMANTGWSMDNGQIVWKMQLVMMPACVVLFVSTFVRKETAYLVNLQSYIVAGNVVTGWAASFMSWWKGLSVLINIC